MMKTTKRGVVTVLGSMNIDLVAKAERLPRPGETVAALSLRKLHGGKGGNQAVAASRAGAVVRMIGCVGDDADGADYLKRLRGEGIDVAGIGAVKRCLTGTALIGVDNAGENLIMVAPEANGRVTKRMVRAQRCAIESADVLLSQFEVPFEAVLEAAGIANRGGVPVVLNPSPFIDSFPWGEVRIAAVVVNEPESRQLFGLNAGALRRTKAKWMAAMKARGIDSVVLTRGAKPTLYLTADGGFIEVATLPVEPVDTVGAGDAFAGVFCAFMAGGAEPARALAAGNCAGALTTLKAGAQESVPNRKRLLSAMSAL